MHHTNLQPLIVASRCTGCERCVAICPTQALAQVDGKAMLLYPDRCTYCIACEDVCPTNAIALPFLIVFAEPLVATYHNPPSPLSL